jgi:hypothetical protein
MVKVSFDELTYESRLETGRKIEQGRERKRVSEKEQRKNGKRLMSSINGTQIKSAKISRMKE